MNNVVAGESSVSVDATLTKTETGYAFEGESAATTCNVKVSGTIENGKLTAAISRTLTSALAGTMELNFIPSTGEGLMAQTYAYFNTGNEQMDAMLNGMAAVHKDALTILGGLDILPEGMELESIVNILSLDGDFYTIPVNTIKEDNLVTVFLGKAMLTKVWALAKPLIEKIPDENLQSIVNVVGGVMDTAQDIKVGLVFKK